MKPGMKKFAAFMVAAAFITGYVGPFAAPAQAAPAKLAAVGYTDLKEDDEYAMALQAMIEKKVIAGYKDNTVKPNQPVNRAELAKIVVLALDLEQAASGEDDGYNDVAPGQWFHRYVATLTKHGIQLEASDKLQPRKPVTQQELVNVLADVLNKDGDIIQAWLNNYEGNKPATRGLVAHVLHQAQLAKSSQTVITNITPLNSVTLQVTFSKPLTAEEVNLDNASKNFVFNNDLKIVNVPQLKTGATQTYIVPTTTQKAGTPYTLKYGAEQAVSFTGTDEKIRVSSVQQVTNDTVQVVSNRTDGVVDYGYVIAAYRNGRGAMAMQLDEKNSANGVTYEIIPSLRSRTATLTPNNGGAAITANYVPFTQSTDGRQAPKFRLPQGVTLQPGVTYTITSDWMEVKDATFTATEIAPLALQSAKQVSPTSLELTLSADPKDELLAGRSVTLTAADGSQLTATYKFSSRKGATGTFDIANNGQLKLGTTYTVTAVNGWATANQVSFTTEGTAENTSETVITNITPLNSVTLQVTFSKPLTAEEVNLDNASKNFVFNNDLKIVNVPQLKTGATQTYIVPTTTQKAGTSYTLKYRDEQAASFTGTDEKIRVSSIQQVTNDTVQVVSNRTDGVVDYGYVIAAYRNGRGAMAMQLDEKNSANGVTYEIIPSLRSRTATLTPNNGGAAITANYVPFTQSTDGRQAPKFRLPQGVTLQPGVTYTITSDWMEVKDATFTATEIAPLALQSAKQVSPTSLELTLAADPQDELLAGRSVTLTAADGSQLTATYKFSSRKGTTGTFDIANNGQLKPGTTYTVTAVNGWATASQVTVTAQ